MFILRCQFIHNVSGGFVIAEHSFTGYILDCLPSAVEEWENTNKQLEFIKALKLNPDIIINLKVQCLSCYMYMYVKLTV